jgi:UDP-N-acetylmuramate dehydrogenase
MRITQDQPLKEHNTFGLDVRAVFFIEMETEEDVRTLARDEYFRTLPFITIGEGSNLLFNGDFKGAVLRFTGDSVTTVAEDDRTIRLRIDAGKRWRDLVKETVTQGLWGIENLALIPGDAGAAAVQNIGAYGAEICDVLDTIHYVDLRDGSTHALPASEAKYSYRHSIFKEPSMSTAVVTSIELTLSKEPKPRLEYKGLSGLRDLKQLTPARVANEVAGIRRSKLPDPELIPNAGSFFMNPFISPEDFERLRSTHPDIPHYPSPDGTKVKIPAAWLIQQVGMKGYRDETVGTYDKQPLVLINHHHGTSADIRRMAETIIGTVRDTFGIELHPEVRYVRSIETKSIKQIELEQQGE